MLNLQKKQAQILIKTPAKITPLLQVFPKRPDRFHQVRIFLVPIGLFDHLELILAPQPGIHLQVEGAELGPEENNLVVQAARAFAEATAQPLGVQIRLEKTIPHGAGLGGGSGNAAGTLIGLNHLFGNPLEQEVLKALAAQLGSDVPFFLNPTPSLAEGRGEILTPLERFPDLSLLVVSPPFSMSTSQAFGMITPQSNQESLPSMIDLESVNSNLINQFEKPLFREYPELKKVKESLIEAGALGALLSGSGTALFGLFGLKASRDQAAESITLPAGWRIMACESLRQHLYI